MEVPSMFLNKMLSEMARRNASSLHLSIGSLPSARIGKDLIVLDEKNIVSMEMINGIINSFIKEDDVKALQENKEVVLVRELSKGLRFRINIIYQKSLPALSFFYIPKDLKSLKELGVPSILKDFIEKKSGIIVVAGAYGAGKTATINSLIDFVNSNYNKYIITIEDPIEYIHTSKKSIVIQRAVGDDVNSVADGLKFCLSEDVDIIAVAENNNIEDYIEPLVDLAAGNTKILLEVNANSAIAAIEKITNALAEKTSPDSAGYRLADTLVCAVGQKLIPRIGGGMVLAAEVVTINSATKALIREGKTSQIESIIQTSREDGMVSMQKSIDELRESGIIK